MYGLVYLIDVQLDNESLITHHSVYACTGSTHVVYELKVEEFAQCAVTARIQTGFISTSNCDQSCRKPTHNIRDELWNAQPAFMNWRHLPEDREARDERRQVWEEFRAKIGKAGFRPTPYGKAYKRICYPGGDSCEDLICCGEYHVKGECSEYGTPFYWEFAGHCDRTCEQRLIKLPASVSKMVEANKHGLHQPKMMDASKSGRR
ncbi:MAG: hypothetical protein ABII13_01495 [Patescibacteria group bacterium]